ncbi:MAG: isocitrate/isopropylmalate dehydrogenase family protein [Dinoroseobacter sp.]|nr:isocitrate/isopropylmalate dehydrogenase family protein [Dinoroseobacter sp.]
MKLCVLEGDGIGPEITTATLSVLQAVDEKFSLGLHFTAQDIGFKSHSKSGTTFPDHVLAAARDSDGIVLGPVSHNEYPPVAEGGLNPSGRLRIELDLYANIRPARTRAFLPRPVAPAFDLVVLRENTEGFYADRNMASGPGEVMPDPDMALALRKITRHACARIAKDAFALAATRRGKVTAVHKANVLRLSDGLFLEETRKAAAAHPEIAYDEVLIDAMVAHVVRTPDAYDVIVTTNMYGDILSDLTSELSGSLGLAASLNAGTEHAMAQAQHGSAPDIAGHGIANPASLIGSAAMLLGWLGHRHMKSEFLSAQKALGSALETALEDSKARTPDLGGQGTTHGFAAAIISAL